MKPSAALLGSVLVGASLFVHAEVAVILNASSSSTPSQADVANVFLGRDTTLKAIDQKDWTTTKKVFYSSVTSKNESQLKSYWSGLIFTGKGQPLPSVADDAAVVDQVSTQTDAIGYVDASAVNDKVKVLFRLP